MFRALAALVLLVAGCAGTRATAPTEAPAPPPTTNTTVAFESLYGGSAHRSRYPLVPPQDELLRWRVPDAILDPHAENAPVEPWTFELLQNALGVHGVTLHGPVSPPPTGADAPTMELRHVDFASGTDAFPVVVRTDGDVLRLFLRSGREQSLCDRALHVDLGFVILRGTLLRLQDGAVSALFDQFHFVEAAGPARLAAPLPGTDDSRFCAALQALLDGAEELEPTDGVFVGAARVALDAALGPLFRAEP